MKKMYDEDFYNRLSPVLRRAYQQASMSDDEDLKLLAQEMERDYRTILDSSPTLDDSSTPGILLGTTTWDEPNFPVNTPIYATLQDCLANIVIAGMTGSGKSETASYLARRFSEYKMKDSPDQRIQVVMYDSKRDHLPLALREGWLWLPTRLYYRNTLVPPSGVPAHIYYESDTEIWCVANDLTNVGTNVMKGIQELADRKCKAVNLDHDATYYEYIIAENEVLSALPYRERARFDVYARLMARTVDMVIGPYEEPHRVRRGLTDEDLEGLNIVRDISDLSTQRALYEVNHDANRAFVRARWNNLRGPKAQPRCAIIEEATKLLHPRFVSRVTHFDDNFKMGREYSQFFVLIVHSMILLPTVCKNNTGVFLLMQNGNYEEILTFAQIAGMDEVHIKLAQELKPGEAICKLSRYPQCVKIKIPYEPLNKDVDMSFLEQKTMAFLEPKKAGFVWVDPKQISYVKKIVFKTDFAPRTAEEISAKSKENLEENLKKLIVKVWKDQDSPYKNIRREFSSTAMIDEVKQYAVQNDYLTTWAFSLTGDGRPPTFFGLTEKARKVLLESGVLKESDPLHSVKGLPPQGIVCRFIQKKYQERKLRAELEGFLNRADVSIYNNDGSPWICFEVSITQPVQKELENIKRDLSFGFRRVIVVVLQFRELGRNEHVFDKVAAENKQKKLQAEIDQQLGDSASNIELWTLEDLRKKL